MVTVLPMKDIEREEQLKKALVERFLRNDNLSNDDSRFRVTSIYWERIADGGKNFTRENIGGCVLLSLILMHFWEEIRVLCRQVDNI